MYDILNGLNEGQRSLASLVEGPALASASAGSGKTTTLTRRIMNMLESEAMIEPHSILCLTFTDSGAVAMRQKLLKEIGVTAYQVTISTFHSFCNDVIQNNSSYFGVDDLQPISRLEEITLMESIINRLEFSHALKRTRGNIYYEVPRCLALFGFMKQENFDMSTMNMLIDKFILELPNHPDYVYKRANSKKNIQKGDPNLRLIDEVKEKLVTLKAAVGLFDIYNSNMAERKLYDFNDMIQWVLNAFKENENILRDYQERYQYVTVDECQDTSGSQHEIVNLLMDFWSESNVVMLGDQRQCQPGDTLVRLIDGSEKKISEIEVGDRVVAYDSQLGKIVGDYSVGETSRQYGTKITEIAKRNYTGPLYHIEVSGRKSSYTPNHFCMVKWSGINLDGYGVYVMQKGDYFRIGMAPIWTTDKSNSITSRAVSEKADKMWILKAFNNRKDAWKCEQINSILFSIPKKCFTLRSQKNVTITQDDLDEFFSALDPIKTKNEVVSLLKKFNRNWEFPFWTKGEKRYNSKYNLFKIRACNIIPEYMQVGLFNKGESYFYRDRYLVSDVIYKDIDSYYMSNCFSDYVYSLDVSLRKTYIADGIITHNCIYEFAGSRLQNIKDFIDKYNPQIISLDKNYRSTQEIVDCSVNVIDKSVQLSYLDNNIQGMNTSDGEVTASRYQSFTHENQSVVEKVLKLIDEGVTPSEIAIIYRKHSDCKRIYDHLSSAGVAVNTKRRINVLDEPIIIQILSILEYLDSDFKLLESDKFFEMLHYHFVGVPRKQIEKLLIMKRESKDVDKLDKRSFKAVNAFINTLANLETLSRNGSVLMLISSILYKTGIRQMLLSDRDIRQTLILRTFFDFVKTENEKDVNMTISNFLELIRRMRSNHIQLGMDDVSGDADGVFFTTCHGSKGLEFEHVFMIRCNRTDWEKTRSMSSTYYLPDTITYSRGDDKEESARRLFYVAMTRAKTHLYMSCSVKDDKSKDVEPSLFLIESGVEILDIPTTELFDQLIADLSVNTVKFSPKIESDRIKEILDNFRMSPTALNSYLKCPLSFYYERILKVPFMESYALMYGTLFHRTIEESKKRFKSRTFILSEIMEWANELIDNRLAVNITKVEKATLKAALLETFPGFVMGYLQTSPSLSIPEFKIRDVIIEDVPVYGELDDIEIHGNEVVITDYKSGSEANIKKAMKKGEGYIWRQLVFYKLLIDNHPKKNWVTQKTRVVGINKQPFVLEYEVGIDDINIVKQQISSSYKRIMNMEFDGCGDPECKWCNIIKECKND